MYFSPELSETIKNDLIGINDKSGQMRLFGFATSVVLFRYPALDTYKTFIEILFNLSTPVKDGLKPDPTTVTTCTKVVETFFKKNRYLTELNSENSAEQHLHHTRQNKTINFKNQLTKLLANVQLVYRIYFKLGHKFVDNTLMFNYHNIADTYQFNVNNHVFIGENSALIWLWLHPFGFLVEKRIRCDQKHYTHTEQMIFRINILEVVATFIIICPTCQSNFRKSVKTSFQKDPNLKIDSWLIRKHLQIQNKDESLFEEWYDFWNNFTNNLTI